MKPIYWFKSLIALSIFLLMGSAEHAKVEVNWVNPASYTDLEPGHSNSKRNFQRRFFQSIERHLRKEVAAKLPANYTLAVAVYDVDLSGTIKMDSSYAGMKMLRMIGREHPPTVEFGYILVDENRTEVSKGATRLTDKRFKYRLSHEQEFLFEKRLMSKWLKKRLASFTNE